MVLMRKWVDKDAARNGFTLIEVLVGLAVSGILIVGVYEIMVNQNRIYIVEELSIAMQQDARAALDFVSRELRLAGFGVGDGSDARSTVFTSLVNNASGVDGVDGGTDSIEFVADTKYGSLVARPAAADSDEVLVYPAPQKQHEFEGGKNGDRVDIIVFHRGRKVRLNTEPLSIKTVAYRASSDNPPLTRVVFSKRLNAVLTSEAKGKGLIEGDHIVVCPISIRYRVRRGTLERTIRDADGTATTQPLIDNVDDLQLAYAFDGGDPDTEADLDWGTHASHTPRVLWAVDVGNTGMLNTAIDAGRIMFAGADTAYRSGVANDIADEPVGDSYHTPLRSVKVSLLLRSSRQNPDHRLRNVQMQPSVQDHDPTMTKKDGFRRRLYETEITFRNLGLNPPRDRTGGMAARGGYLPEENAEG